MKNLILSIIITSLLNSSSRYTNFEGTWKSYSTKYTLVISKSENQNKYKMVNYKIIKIQRCSEDAGYYEVIYSPEEFIKAENGNLYSFVSWDDFGSFNCDVVYEMINENKIKATFSGDRNLVIFYHRSDDESDCSLMDLYHIQESINICQ